MANAAIKVEDQREPIRGVIEAKNSLLLMATGRRSCCLDLWNAHFQLLSGVLYRLIVLALVVSRFACIAIATHLQQE